jgi:tripartite-type tricarboxylate transporter receptor subunit TctC
LFMERLRLAAGFPATRVPFRGTPEGMKGVVASRIDLYPAPVLNALPLAEAGKVHMLAISAAKRLALIPDVPTLAEAGLPDAPHNFWIGAFAPAKTPKPIVERLNREVAIALRSQAIADKIRNLGGEPTPMTAAELDAFVRKEIAADAEIVKASGYKPQQSGIARAWMTPVTRADRETHAGSSRSACGRTGQSAMRRRTQGPRLFPE